MRSILLCTALFAFIIVTFSCGGSQSQSNTSGGGGDSPTDAYKKLYNAVKSKDIETIKGLLSKKSLELGKFGGERNKKPESTWYENGMTSTTFSNSLPTMRDERINGDMGALEVWNSRDSKWDDIPFIKEDGTWKLAFGDIWANTWTSPGKGRALLEKEAANAVSNNNMPVASVNTNNIPVVNAMPPQMQKSAPQAK
jgi:hypothetical protein